jgi:hypothetical protein
MYPTFFPGDVLTIEVVPRRRLSPGDVVAIVGDIVETDGGLDRTERQAVLTHRLLRRDDDAVYTTGDLDPATEWATDPADAVVGRVVDLAPTVDGWERESIRLLWYWERLALVACNCRARPVVETVVPLLSDLLYRTVDRLDGGETSLVSLDLSPGDRTPRALARTLADCFTAVTSVLDLPSDGSTATASTGPCPLWDGDVSTVSVATLADATELVEVIETGRRRARPVLPVGDAGTSIYPTVTRRYGVTPCSGCEPTDPRCRGRETLRFDAEFVSERVAPAEGGPE